METRSIVDSNLNVVGELTMPEGTSEEIWTAKMSAFKITPQEKLARALTLKVKERKEFADDLMERFKQRNIADGINAAQGLWMHHRIRALDITVSSIPMTVDLANFIISGDVELACISLQYAQPDDMSLPYHWMSQARVDWLVTELKKYLGWP